MKIEANVNTNPTNMRRQLESLRAIAAKATAEAEVLEGVIAAREAWLQGVKGTMEKRRAARVAAAPKYPPWIKTAAQQERYRKRLERDGERARRAEEKARAKGDALAP